MLMRIECKPEMFVEAYQALLDILPLGDYTYQADPRAGTIVIDEDMPQLTAEDQANLMLWKLRYK
jgi:hypothetical protein